MGSGESGGLLGECGTTGVRLSHTLPPPYPTTPTGPLRGRTRGLTIFPAIDLRQGQVVRLRQGDPAAQTVYGDDPAAVARRWADQGAEWLHVVNLDGAFSGRAEAEVPSVK